MVRGVCCIQFHVASMVEMLDGESTAIEETALKDVTGKGIKINRYVHDVSCKVKAKFEGKYCRKCLLDGYHGGRHKCGLKSMKHLKGKNSQACEQLWSRLDKLSFVTEMSRARHTYVSAHSTHTSFKETACYS